MVANTHTCLTHTLHTKRHSLASYCSLVKTGTEELAAELAKAGKDRLASLATAPDKVGPALLTFASFVDEAEPGVISAPLRRALGLEARA